MLLIVGCCLLLVLCDLWCAVYGPLLKFRLSLRVVRCLSLGACFCCAGVCCVLNVIDSWVFDVGCLLFVCFVCCSLRFLCVVCCVLFVARRLLLLFVGCWVLIVVC